MRKKTVGVVVGRFQLPALHAGHLHLLSWANARSDVLSIVLGIAKAFPSPRNGLPAHVRQVLIREHFPHATIHALEDMHDDVRWSHALDALLTEQFPECDIALYGSRDSFLSSYRGVFEVRRVPEIQNVSATRVREALLEYPPTESYRAGWLGALSSQRHIGVAAVDVACIRHADNHVLLARKKSDPPGLYRFPGGHVDPQEDSSLEAAAIRELREETGISLIHELTYVGSTKSEDAHYRGEPHQMFAVLYKAYYMGGVARAADDIVEVLWAPLARLRTMLVPEHLVLGERLLSSCAL